MAKSKKVRRSQKEKMAISNKDVAKLDVAEITKTEKKPGGPLRKERQAMLLQSLADHVWGKGKIPDQGTNDRFHGVVPKEILKTKARLAVEVEGAAMLMSEETILSADAPGLLKKGKMEKQISKMLGWVISDPGKFPGEEDGKLTVRRDIRLRVDAAGSQHVKLTLRCSAARV